VVFPTPGSPQLRAWINQSRTDWWVWW